MAVDDGECDDVVVVNAVVAFDVVSELTVCFVGLSSLDCRLCDDR